ncbi:MAG: GNAT family N-acetyltransferase [Pirellulales bacterium]
MTADLDIHLASDEELREAHANVHDVWHMGLPLEAHIERRLTAPHHRRATWIVGCLDRRVVCCLGLHPLEFRVSGQVVPSVGVASVHTLAEFRGRGFAPNLIAWAEDHARSRGVQLSVLFSDVKPAYYQRMGYLLVPAHRGELTVADHLAAAQERLDETRPRIEPLAAQSHIETLQRIYNEAHAGDALAIERDQEYWNYLLACGPSDEFLSLCRADESGPFAYARWKVADDALFVRDLAVAANSELASVVYAALVRRARELDLKRVVGWLPNGAVERRWFDVEPRPIEITMFKPLVSGLHLSAEHLAAADRLNEIDHV